VRGIAVPATAVTFGRRILGQRDEQTRGHQQAHTGFEGARPFAIWEKTEFQFLSSSRLIRGLPELASQTRPEIFQPEGKLDATGEIGITITRKYSSAPGKSSARCIPCRPGWERWIYSPASMRWRRRRQSRAGAVQGSRKYPRRINDSWPAHRRLQWHYRSRYEGLREKRFHVNTFTTRFP
jgi:hypothetical protein